MPTTHNEPKQLIPGEPVKFASRGIIESMKFTRLIALFDRAAPEKIGKRAEWEGRPRPQKRYIIEHLFGWLPSNQPLLNNSPVKAELDPIRRYAFAYQDELFPISEEEFKTLQHAQKSKA